MNTTEEMAENNKNTIEDQCLICLKTVSLSGNAKSCDQCGQLACSSRHLSVHQAWTGSHCLPFRVAINPKIGRHFIATRDIEPLELVLIDSPSVIGPATKTRPVCLECLRPLQPLKDTVIKCPGCGFPMCSKKCISEGQKQHSRECRLLERYNKPVPLDQESLVYAAIFVLRFWLLKDEDPKEHKEACFLMEGDLSNQDFSSVGKEVVRIIQKDLQLPQIRREEILRYMGIKRTNANNMSNLGKVGNILYPVYPLMNSHCSTNTRCRINPDNFNIEVRAQRPIKAGQQITTRYISSMECQPRRQQKIWQNWKFLCQCQRCQDPTESGTLFSGIKCQKCPSKGEGILLPLDTTMLGTPWHCTVCGVKCGQGQIEAVLRDCESKIRNFRGEEWTSLAQELEGHLSRDHLFLVCLRERQVFHRLSADTRTRAGLEGRISLVEELVDLVERIDPGLTSRKGKLFQVLAKDRLCLAKLLLSGEGGVKAKEEEEEGKRALKKAAVELKNANLCLKYS